MKNINEVREFFAHDRFAAESGAYIEEIGDHYAKCSMEITSKHLNAAGAVMGGATFVLADFAYAVAANWQHEPNVGNAVSLNSSITFYGTAKGTKLVAEAHCLKDGHTTCCYEVLVYDDLSRPVAAVMMTGFKKA